MVSKVLPGFEWVPAHHCVTGSMRHIYLYNDHSISEEMLLGLGVGVGFVYWHQKGMTPFIGGRARNKKGFENVACERTGVVIGEHTTSSARKAERSLLEMLSGEQPVMIQCDMGYLPYFDFGGYDYHFGGHVVVVCGYDGEMRQVLVADRDGLYPVPMDDLEKARGSKHKPFPPKHKWYTFNFSRKRQPTPEEVREAIREGVKGMLEPPISNLGVKGIRKAARMVLKWPGVLDEDELRGTLFNSYVFIDALGGTGGGMFRYMFSRFLHEAAEITGEPLLRESADEFRRIGDRWQVVAEDFKRAAEVEDPASVLPEVTAGMAELADLEEAAWARLRESV